MIGTVKGEFSVELPPIIKQSNFGILTENGIVKSELTLVMFFEDKAPRQYRPIEGGVNTLQNLLKNLRATYEELEVSQARSLPNLPALQSKIKNELKELKHALVQEDYDKYLSTSSLQGSQAHLLEFAEFMLTRAMDNEEDIKKQIYETLRAIMCRKELDLEHIGFQTKSQSSGLVQNQGIKASSNLSVDKEAELMKIGLKYFSFLNSCLRLVLVNIRSKALEPYERSFIQFCLNFCFFRMTPFQKLLTKVFDSTHTVSPALPNIAKDQWKKYYLGAGDYEIWLQKNKKGAKSTAVLPEIQEMSSLLLFDWDQSFFSHLEKQAEFPSQLSVFNELIGDTDWSKILGKKGTGFFHFINESSGYLQDTLSAQVSSKIDILEIPGYDILISTFIHELRTKEVIAYTDAQLQALLSTLETNPKLVNTYFTIVAQQTK